MKSIPEVKAGMYKTIKFVIVYSLQFILDIELGLSN